MSPHRIAVDWSRCDGHGLCARLLAERIALDDWGFPVVSPAPLTDDDLGRARAVVRACPQLALRIEHT